MNGKLYKSFLKNYIKNLKEKEGVDMTRFKNGVTKMTEWLLGEANNMGIYFFHLFHNKFPHKKYL